ncbi:hypothetical protein [Lacinutrix sp. Bg11-31]|uniref:hypothetical protein n=1 Tax=Lacinutrix sp. Bg11-31 TaxID=2057808 RepID=UPI000C310C17|nr:hypothetical protein [Lacinutrix sp. Bg11-31]AUC82283.1 hypothetical protein CW733_09140 [Lacinutrix sp. Bg11-31]
MSVKNHSTDCVLTYICVKHRFLNALGKILIVSAFLFVNKNCKAPSSSVNVGTESEMMKVEGEIKIRYIEMYGSVCCPRDYKHDNHLLNYIKDFETENNISLAFNFKLQLGREGEAVYFLSLENLSFKQQENFINERSAGIKSDDKSVVNNLNNPVSIKKHLESWDNVSINNLIKF